MVSIIASHGLFAEEGVNSAKMLFGSAPENLHILSLLEDDDGIEMFEKKARELSENIDEEILIFTDFFGGSPFMTLLSVFRDKDFKLISGFNLGMIVDLFQHLNSGLSLDEITSLIIDNAKNTSIQVIDREYLYMKGD